jgi:hypothetical protein
MHTLDHAKPESKVQADLMLLGPVYLNNVLVAPIIIQSLLSICHFTANNSCFMEFDPFSLSVNDLATRSMITRYNSFDPMYIIPLPSLTTSITDAPPYVLAIVT